MLLGYNTNGFAHHRCSDAVEVIASLGYRCVGLSIDHGVLAPGARYSSEQLAWLQEFGREHGVCYVIETGARYLLDAWRKHEPTLVSPEPEARERRLGFYRHAIDTAATLNAVCVSLWSGVVHDGASQGEAMPRLVEGLGVVLRYAAERGVLVAFEPEPGMLIATLADYEHLRERLTAAKIDTAALRLTIDIGHLHCNAEGDLTELLGRYASHAVNMHVEDMRGGVHEHLMFGDGEIDFGPVVATLGEVGYSGPLVVELSRHSHAAPLAARRAIEFLQPLLETSGDA
ncbi:MAG: sugar phosphate isomerase/epimerase family protein [Planctomycetota bacterium]